MNYMKNNNSEIVAGIMRTLVQKVKTRKYGEALCKKEVVKINPEMPDIHKYSVRG